MVDANQPTEDLGICIMGCGYPATVQGGPNNRLLRMCCWSCKGPRPVGWPGSMLADAERRQKEL